MKPSRCWPSLPPTAASHRSSLKPRVPVALLNLSDAGYFAHNHRNSVQPCTRPNRLQILESGSIHFVARQALQLMVVGDQEAKPGARRDEKKKKKNSPTSWSRLAAATAKPWQGSNLADGTSSLIRRTDGDRQQHLGLIDSKKPLGGGASSPGPHLPRCPPNRGTAVHCSVCGEEAYLSDDPLMMPRSSPRQ